MEQTLTTKSDPAVCAMDLAVAMAAGGIRVSAGRVVFDGRADDVPQQDVSIQVRSASTVVFGYLARDVSSDALVLFVDEHLQDGVDDAYTFERDGPYRLLAYLFRVTVPAGTNDLSGLDYDRWRIIAPE